MNKLNIILMMSVITKKFFTQLSTPICEKDGDQKKKFRCKLSGVDDRTDLICTIPSHSCKANRIDHKTGSDGSGELTYTIEITVESYTTDGLDVTVTYTDTDGANQQLCNTVTLKCEYEDIEIPRINCNTPSAVANEFKSTVTCTVYVAISSERLLKDDNDSGKDCEVDIQNPNSNTAEGILHKQTYGFTITDTTSTCKKACSISLKLTSKTPDGKEIVKPLSHTSECSGEQIICKEHNKDERTVTCQINIAYQYVQIKFTSTVEHVQLTDATKKHAFTTLTKNFAKTLNYIITDLQSTEKNFKINYNVIQTLGQSTFTGDDSNVHNYELKPNEIPGLECAADSDKNGVQYYEKRYKCTARSFTQIINFQTKGEEYKISPQTKDLGAASNKLHTESDIKVTLTPKLIECNKDETIDIFFTDKSEKRETSIIQKIECEDPTISSQILNAPARTIEFIIKAQYAFEVSQIQSKESTIQIILPKPVKPDVKCGNPCSITYTVTYKSLDLTKSTIPFKNDITITNGQNYQTKLDSNSFTWTRKAEEDPKLECNRDQTLPELKYYEMGYKCTAQSHRETIIFDTTGSSFNISPQTVNGPDPVDKLYTHKEFTLKLTRRIVVCNEMETFNLFFTESGVKREFLVNQQIICEAPTISSHSQNEEARTIEFTLEAQYTFSVSKIASKEGKIEINDLATVDPAEKCGIPCSISYSVTYKSIDLRPPTISFENELTIIHSKHYTSTIDSSSFKWTRKPTESPILQCERNQNTKELEYYEMILKCTARSHTQTITFETDGSKFEISPIRNLGPSPIYHLYTHPEFKLKLSRKIIACNLEENFELYFTESGKNRISNFNQKITCLKPKIHQKENDVSKRLISWSVSARYHFSITAISSENNFIDVKVPIKTASQNSEDKLWVIDSTGTYESLDISVRQRDFTINIHFKHSDKFDGKITTESYKWIRSDSESPSLTCSLKNGEVPIDFKKFIVSCNALTISQAFKLTPTLSQYVIIDKRVKKLNYKGVFKWDSYEVVIQDNKISCGVNEAVTITYTDNDQDLSQTIQRNAKCPKPTILCYSNDQILRKMKCKFDLRYPVTEVTVTSENTNVVTADNKIVPGDWSNDKVISYTVTDPTNDNKQFKLKFEFIQKSPQIIHTIITDDFEFAPLNEEKTQFSCNIENEGTTEEYGKVSYICNIITTSPEIPFTVSHGYQITPSKTSNKQDGLFYKEPNYQISLTSKLIICGQSEIVKIQFKENQIEYSTHVNHTTTCPEPVILCDKHDAIESSITCDFTIDYEFHEIILAVTSSAVTLDSTTISSSAFQTKTLKDHKIKYTISDRSGGELPFSITFYVYQNNRNLAHKKSLEFRHFVKSDEVPGLSCSKSDSKKKDSFESQIYECTIVSSQSIVNLRTSSTGFTLSPSEVRGNYKNGIYIHEKFLLTITPTSIVCNQENDVPIIYSDKKQNIEFTVKHTTICPDPIINCNEHNYQTREIMCDIQIGYPFESIDIQSTSDHVEVIEGKKILYDTISRKQILNHKLSYQVKDLNNEDHHFNVEFNLKQNGKTLVTIFKNFIYIYIYKSSEIPHIFCSQKRVESETEFTSIIYLCHAASYQSFAELQVDDKTFELTSTPLTPTTDNGINMLTDTEVTIKQDSYICNKEVDVKISLKNVNPEIYTNLFYKVKCPEPKIECVEHRLESKTIKCDITVNFRFKEIHIKTSSLNIRIPEMDNSNSKNNKISADAKGKCNNKAHDIKYEISNYGSKDFYFEIIFDVIQSDESVIFEVKRNFKYELTVDESPYIKCRESLNTPPLMYHQKKYTCDILSVMKKVKIKVDPSTYKIDKKSSSGDDYGSLHKHPTMEIIVEPFEISCDRQQKIRIMFTDLDDMKYSESLLYSIKCPDPTITQPSEISQERKLTLKLEAKYKFEIISVRSNTKSVTLIWKTASQTKLADTWTSEIPITYQPEDWSLDSLDFQAIIEISQTNGWKREIMSNKYTFNLRQEEKPFISCQDESSEVIDDFSQKVFTCSAITRQSILMSNLSDKNYKIVSTKGSSTESKKVYQWNNHEITIQDVAITCNTPKFFDIFFTEYSNMYKYSITMSITCPIPKITISSHDTETRSIILLVEYEFPRFTSQVMYSQQILTFIKTESPITRKNRKWISVVSVEYTLHDLLNTKFTIPFSLSIQQNLEQIGTVELPFNYSLRENEKRQITCSVNLENSKLLFASTEYICYAVGTLSLEITLEPKSYKLLYEKTAPSRFVNILKWENVSVIVQDTSIICNETVNLTLTYNDGVVEKYSTIVQHTTMCDKIDGECLIRQLGATYIYCNFTSNTRFNLRNYSCSDAFNCTRTKEINKTNEKWNEYLFELTLTTTETYLEFEFQINLEHSAHSPVPFTYTLVYSIETEIAQIQKPGTAKIVTSFSNAIIYLAILSVILTYLMLRKWKNSFEVHERSEKTSFRNL